MRTILATLAACFALTLAAFGGATPSFTGNHYGRHYGTGEGLTNIMSPFEPFTIVQIGDLQNLAKNASLDVTNALTWIFSQKTALNIKAIVMPGDLIDTPGSLTEATYATNYLWWIRNSQGIPVFMAHGNHDPTDRVASGFNLIATNQPNGAFAETKNSPDNSGNIFLQTNSNMKMAFITTHWNGGHPAADWNAWISNMCVKYSDYYVTLIQHGFLYYNDEVETNNTPYYNYGDVMWTNALYNARNLNLILCGHETSPTVALEVRAGEAMRPLLGAGGNRVTAIMCDWQIIPTSAGASSARWIRLYTFYPAQNRIHARTYDRTTSLYLCGPYEDFELPIRDTPPLQINPIMLNRFWGPTWAEVQRSNTFIWWSSNILGGTAPPSLWISYFDASSNRVDAAK